MSRYNDSEEGTTLTFIMVILLAIFSFVVGVSNKNDLSKGYEGNTQTAIVWDHTFIGRFGVPTTILKVSDMEYIEVKFETSEEMYSCSNVHDEIEFRKVFGKSGKLRGIKVFCNWGTFEYRQLLNMELTQ